MTDIWTTIMHGTKTSSSPWPEESKKKASVEAETQRKSFSKKDQLKNNTSHQSEVASSSDEGFKTLNKNRKTNPPRSTPQKIAPAGHKENMVRKNDISLPESIKIERSRKFSLHLPHAFVVAVKEGKPIQFFQAEDVLNNRKSATIPNDAIVVYSHPASPELCFSVEMKDLKDNPTHALYFLFASLEQPPDDGRNTEETTAAAVKLILSEMFFCGIFVNKNEQAASLIVKGLSNDVLEEAKHEALVLAVQSGVLGLVQRFLQMGSEVNAATVEDCEALSEACAQPDGRILETLLLHCKTAEDRKSVEWTLALIENTDLERSKATLRHFLASSSIA
jgi:hypothetical protein